MPRRFILIGALVVGALVAIAYFNASRIAESLSSDRLSSEARRTSQSALERCSRSELNGAIVSQGEHYRYLADTRNLTVEMAPARIFDAESLFAAIPENAAVLLYGAEDDILCSWLLDSNGVVVAEVVDVSPQEIPELLHRFYVGEGIRAQQASREPRRRSGTQAQTSEALPGYNVAQLSSLLLPRRVGGHISQYRDVVVVPFGALSAVPFSALSAGDRPWVEFATVSIASNLADLAASGAASSGVRWAPACGEQPLRSVRDRSMSHLPLIVGDPTYADVEFEMPPLPGARSEAQRVAALVGGHALLGEHATLEAVTRSSRDAGLIYMATHGVSYGESGLHGFVALAGGERWTAEAVQRSCLGNARLVVLSACQTGLGQYVDGGAIGLARAFQIAGSPSVVMSLWNVNDAATERLMTTFVGYARDGQPAPAALRRAMLETRELYAETRDWASFTIFVDGFASVQSTVPAEAGSER